MQAVTRKKRISAVDLRARVPAIARGLALLLLIGGAIFVGVSYYKMRNNTPFRLKSEAPALSKEIVGIINGYEQRLTRDNRLYLWLRAPDVHGDPGHALLMSCYRRERYGPTLAMQLATDGLFRLYNQVNHPLLMASGDAGMRLLARLPAFRRTLSSGALQ